MQGQWQLKHDIKMDEISQPSRKQGISLRLLLVCHMQVLSWGEVRILWVWAVEENRKELHRAVFIDHWQEGERYIFQIVLQYSSSVSILLLLLCLPQIQSQIRQQTQRTATHHLLQNIHRSIDQQQEVLLLKVDSRSGNRQYSGKKTQETWKPIRIVAIHPHANHSKPHQNKRFREDEEEIDSADQVQSHRVAVPED